MIIETTLILAACAVSWPVLLLSLEIACALIRYKPRPLSLKGHPTVAILMPAHNEATIIAETLTALQPQLRPEHRLIVIADNCSDNTADIARTAGAEVIVRDDPGNRGKGFALDFGIRHLDAEPPDVVMIVDADCELEDGTLDRLAQTAMETDKPVQALYLIRPHENAGVGQQVSAFAVVLKNHVRLLGLKRLGLPCHLVGTGMAFPWKAICSVELGSGNIVEDMKLGIDLVKAGHGPLFCPEALVNSRFPESISSQQEQRTRWEHGHLQTILSESLGLVWASLRQRRWRGLAFALDLAIPPLSLVCLLILAGLMTTAAARLFGAGAGPFYLMIAVCGLLTLSLFMAWWRFGREVLPAKSLLAVPAYVLPKIFLYLRFVRKRQKDWVRTDRS